MTALGTITTPAHHDDAKTAAKQLEAFFVRQFLAEARPHGGGMIDGGFAGDTFKQMLDEAVADKLAGAGGLGMADMFAKQLGPKDAIAGIATIAPTASRELGPAIDNAPQLQMPVIGRPSSGYGPRVGHDGTTHKHAGLDLSATMGTPVAAAAPGEVTHAGPLGDYGNLVIVRHDDGFETRYAHLSAVGVTRGTRVVAGQLLGNVGSTGLSDGPHLHFELRHDGQPLDPAPRLPLNSPATRPNR